MKWQFMEWEKIFVMHMLDMGSYEEYIKDPINQYENGR